MKRTKIRIREPRHEILAVVVEWFILAVSVLIFVQGIIFQFSGAHAVSFAFYLGGLAVFVLSRAISERIRYPPQKE